MENEKSMHISTHKRKERVALYIDSDVKNQAKNLGLNLSRIAQNALENTILSVIGANPAQHCEGRGRDLNPGARLHRPEVDSTPGLKARCSIPAEQPAQPVLASGDVQATLTEFKRFLKVDLQRKKLTVNGHAQTIARLLKWLEDRPVTRDILRDYLDHVQTERPGAYKNTLSALKVFFRDYLNRPDLVATFRFPEHDFTPPDIPEKDKLQQFYHALGPLDLRVACYFLLYATSGWRRREVMALHKEDADLPARTLTPRIQSSSTKGRLPGFFNQEAQEVLTEYTETRRDPSPKLLPISERTFRPLWHQAAEECGFMLQPQLLRDWFCEEMGNLGVPDRYIDAFCGRVPKSVLAKHYTDYAPDKLKRIYDRAGLTVLA